MIAIFPEIVNLAAKGDIENLACMVRKYFGGPQAYSPVLNVERLMVHAGITTKEFSNAGIGALVAEDSNGRFSVSALINPQIHNSTERNLLLAHLLGHFLLQVQPEIARGEVARHGFKEALSPLQRLITRRCRIDEVQWQHEEDRQADLFALALLLPLGMLRRSVSKLVSVDRVAAFFGLVPALIQLRLDQLTVPPVVTIRPASPAAGFRSPSASAMQHHDKLDLFPGIAEFKNSFEHSQENLDQMGDQPAIIRGQRLIAGQRYLKQSSNVGSPIKESESGRRAEPLEGGLKRLRQIAKRLDSSVKI